VRGEGAHLVSEAGDRFMVDEHPDAELAPRDVVTRVIQARLDAGRTSYLSLRHLDSDRVRRRFPNLVEGCARLGIDLCADPVPVAPAAHYLMGGIATDLHGATSLAGLYASGESACTGAHGANRLASNSLLECFVFAHRAVAAGLDAVPQDVARALPPERPLARAQLAELRRRMWSGAGPVRDREGTRAAPGLARRPLKRSAELSKDRPATSGSARVHPQSPLGPSRRGNRLWRQYPLRRLLDRRYWLSPQHAWREEFLRRRLSH
jgi:L-aspartate oxidase